MDGRKRSEGTHIPTYCSLKLLPRRTFKQSRRLSLSRLVTACESCPVEIGQCYGQQRGRRTKLTGHLHLTAQTQRLETQNAKRKTQHQNPRPKSKKGKQKLKATTLPVPGPLSKHPAERLVRSKTVGVGPWCALQPGQKTSLSLAGSKTTRGKRRVA